LPPFLFLQPAADTPAYEAPRVDAAVSTLALKQLPRKQGELIAVSIYEFRSTVSEIATRGATDSFKAALIRSRQFRVIERSRLNAFSSENENVTGSSSLTRCHRLEPSRRYAIQIICSANVRF
jgi:curli biogenesis system outer membrane secretion channel CsgG